MPHTARMLVPQGVGDVFWIWRKLYPYYDEIRFTVIDTGDLPRPVARRAEPTIRSLPKVTSVDYERVKPWPDWVSRKVPLAALLPEIDAGRRPAWAVNPWLESGIPLEAVDPKLEVAWDVPLPVRPIKELADPKCLAVYLSGDTVRHGDHERPWSIDQWVQFVDRVCYFNGVGTSVPVVLIGAAFDYPVTARTADELNRRGFRTTVLNDLELGELVWLFANAKVFLGYQSGLNVVCDAAGGRQCMLYYPRYVPVGATWVHPARRTPEHFTYHSFAAHPEAVARTVLLSTGVGPGPT